MSEITKRIKEQLDQFSKSIDQVINASRGLYLKIREESNKQFEELVKTGESQQANDAPLLTQLRKDITAPFEDVKGSLRQLRNASIGLVVKARETGEQYFDELVELGTSHQSTAE